MMLQVVRTTVTLEPDVEALVRQVMTERGLGFKEAVNEAIRVGLAGGRQRPGSYRVRSFHMGVPFVPLDKALQLAADLEDDERRRKLTQRR